jgi:uncharacterized membrane protein YciS (DUF1049 family)
VSEIQTRFVRYTNPVVWGLCLTILLGLLVAFLAVQLGPDGSNQFSTFLSSPPNAIGDTLAGIFAPLAFIWIVVTVFLQSQELREQRAELSLTRQELKLAREAQEKQLAVMQIQADIFADEKRQRDEVAADAHVNELVESLVDEFSKGDFASLRWYFSSKDDAKNYDASGSWFEARGYWPKNVENHELFFAETVSHLNRELDKAIELARTMPVVVPPGERTMLKCALSLISSIDKQYPALSVAKQVKIDRLKILQLPVLLHKMKGEPILWLTKKGEL